VSATPAPAVAGSALSRADVVVREARLADVGQLVDLYIRGSGEGRRYYHPFRFDPVIVRLVFSYFVLSRPAVPGLMRIFPHRSAIMLVATHRTTGAVVGFGTIRFVRRAAGAPAAKYGFLVDQRFRGLGIGTLIGESMLARSRSLGLREGVATILRDNAASIRVAERFGFRVDPSTFQDRGAPGQPTVEIHGELSAVGHGAVPPLQKPRPPPAP
jgi:RimJ/RimL family protein N-acetyltransferase